MAETFSHDAMRTGPAMLRALVAGDEAGFDALLHGCPDEAVAVESLCAGMAAAATILKAAGPPAVVALDAILVGAAQDDDTAAGS